jgi:hypothetical protein
MELCECGKPAEHVNAPEDSAEWGCRVPVGMLDGRLIYAGTTEALKVQERTAARMEWLRQILTPEEWALVEAGRLTTQER